MTLRRLTGQASHAGSGKHLQPGYDINPAFVFAGFLYGRPMGDPPNNPVFAGVYGHTNWSNLVLLFSDAVINDAIVKASNLVDIPADADNDAAFDRSLAAELLETCLAAGMSADGRILQQESFSGRDFRSTFVSPSVSMRIMTDQIRRLRQNSGEVKTSESELELFSDVINRLNTLIPQGSDALNRLVWSEGAWQAQSSVTTVYYFLVKLLPLDQPEIADILAVNLNLAGDKPKNGVESVLNRGFAFNGIRFRNYASIDDDLVIASILAPTHLSWIDDFRIKKQGADADNQVVMKGWVGIDGVPYDIRYIIIDKSTEQPNLTFIYTAPESTISTELL